MLEGRGILIVKRVPCDPIASLLLARMRIILRAGKARVRTRSNLRALGPGPPWSASSSPCLDFRRQAMKTLVNSERRESLADHGDTDP